MSLKDDLIAAKALIDTPDKWCKDYMHTDDGRYCAVGACAHIDHGARTLDALYEHRPAGYEGMISFFNDEPYTTHADIMALFDRAINAASIASLDAAIAECAKPLPRHA